MAFAIIVGCAFVVGMLAGYAVVARKLRELQRDYTKLEDGCRTLHDIAHEANDRANFFLRRNCYLAAKLAKRDGTIARMKADVRNGEAWKWE